MRAGRERDVNGPRANADRKIANGSATIRGREVVRGSARALHDERIGDEGLKVNAGRGRPDVPTIFEGRSEIDQRIRDGRAGGFDRGLAGATFVGVAEDAILRGTQSDDRHRGHGEREDGEDERLPAIAAHGVHSINRAASPRTTSAGRPMNDSGAAIA